MLSGGSADPVLTQRHLVRCALCPRLQVLSVCVFTAWSSMVLWQRVFGESSLLSHKPGAELVRTYLCARLKGNLAVVCSASLSLFSMNSSAL